MSNKYEARSNIFSRYKMLLCVVVTPILVSACNISTVREERTDIAPTTVKVEAITTTKPIDIQVQPTGVTVPDEKKIPIPVVVTLIPTHVGTAGDKKKLQLFLHKRLISRPILPIIR